MEFHILKKEIDDNKIRNFYVFTGEEREVMLKYVKRIHSKAQTVPSFKSIILKLQNKGLFNVDQTFVIHDDKDVMEYDPKDLMNMIGNNTIILIYEKLDERTKFAKAVKPFHFEFKKFTDAQLAVQVQKLISVPDDIALMIARYCGCDVARIENECHKLRHLFTWDTLPWDNQDKDGTQIEVEMPDKIDDETIRQLIVPPLEDRIFEMIDCVMQRKPKRVFKIYHDLLEMKESPIKVISILYTKFKQVFLIQAMNGLSNQELSGKTGMTFFQVDMAKKLVGHFALEELLHFLQQIQKTEVKMKTGQVDIELGMENLFVDILK